MQNDDPVPHGSNEQVIAKYEKRGSWMFEGLIPINSQWSFLGITWQVIRLSL